MADDGRRELEIPALDFVQSGLQEEREQYDITVKLFYLPGNRNIGNVESTPVRDGDSDVLKKKPNPLTIEEARVGSKNNYYSGLPNCILIT